MRHLIGAGVVATTADAATTWLAIQVAATQAGVQFVELNPAVAALISAHGPAAAMSVRVLVGLGLFGFLGWAAGRSRWGLRPLIAATSLTCMIVVWNLGMLASAVA